MLMKFKTILIVIVLILGLLVVNFNNGFAVTKNTTESSRSTSQGGEPLSNGGINWSQIEVLSEPIAGQNFNSLVSSFPRVAVEDDQVYVVWIDLNDTHGAGTDSDIFYRNFNGNEWSDVQVISEPVFGSNSNTAQSARPDVVVENGSIYVVWHDSTNVNGAGTDSDIFFRCNLSGQGWGAIQIISEPVVGNNINTDESYIPKIAIENGKIYCVWYDDSVIYSAGTDDDIFYTCNLTGSNWEPIQVISEPVAGNNYNLLNSVAPVIAVENGKLYVAWYDENNTNGAGTDYDIFYRCNLTGTNWEDVQVISEPVFGQNINTGWISQYPSIDVENGKIFVVWHDDNNTNGAGTDFDVFYRSNTTGFGWDDVQVISEPATGKNHSFKDEGFACVRVTNDKIYVVWFSENNTNNCGGTMMEPEIFFICNLTGFSWENVQVISEPVSGQNFNVAESSWPSIAVENEDIHILWTDMNNTNGANTDADIFYRRTSFTLNLVNPKVTPTFGNTSTNFNFTVKYVQIDNKPPTQIKVNISGIEYPMLEVDPSDMNYVDGKEYYFTNFQLNIGIHKHQFYTSDGITNKFTSFIFKPVVYNMAPNIATQDNQSAIEDEYYENNYAYEDIDIVNVGQLGTWNYSTNATWLTFNFTISTLNGTPSNDDVGTYWVNISIFDTMELDFTNFTLTVIDVNDDPIINTSDIEVIYEDKLYEVDYNATDIDSPNGSQIWTLETNASLWLVIDTSSGMLSGTPTNDNVGTYWVNVSVNDSEGGFDFTNFTLTVTNVNNHPLINTTNVKITYEDALYEVDYNATDVDSLIVNQVWTLSTNASSWLNINPATGILSGTPTNDDIGEYWVNVSVADTDGGSTFTLFNLTVLNTNDRPIIDNIDNLTATQGVYYQENYTATDIDPADILVWTFDTNATWLNWGESNQTLYGIPEDSDVGTQWVKINVSDGVGGFDEHLFDITVENVNDLPVFTKIRGTAPPANDTLNMGAIYIGEYDNFSVEAFDVDYDDLNLYTNNEDLSITKTDWNTWDISYSPTVIGRFKTNLAVLDDGYYGDYLHLYWDVKNRPPSLTITTENNREIEVAGTYTYILGTWTDPDQEIIDTIRVKQKFPDGTETEFYKGGYTKEEYGTKSWYYVSGQLLTGVYVWEYLSVYDNHTWIYMFDAEVYNMAYDFYSVNQPEMMEMFGLVTKVTEGDMEFTFKAGDNYDTNSTEESITVTYTIDEGEDDPEGDLDNDGLPNGWESDNGLDPLDDGTVNIDNGPDGDPDGDSYTNLQEYREGTDPQDATSYPTEIEPPDEEPDEDDEPDDNSAMIAGAVILIIIIIIVLIVVWLFFLKKKPAEEAPVETPPVAPPPPLDQPPVPVIQPALPPPVAPPPVAPQPVVQPTVTPQVIPTVTEAPVTEESATDEELEE